MYANPEKGIRLDVCEQGLYRYLYVDFSLGDMTSVLGAMASRLSRIERLNLSLLE